jgi:mRNA interferase MazF
MRSIRLVAVDGKPRPALVLTADDKREHARRVTVAPISFTVRGSSTELRVGPVEGLDHESVVKCEHIQTVAAALTVRKIGLLPTSRGAALRQAVVVAFDLLPLPVA